MREVIKATILNYIRRKKTIVFLVLFPLFLIAVVGFTTQNSFTREYYSEEDIIEVVYVNEGNEDTDIVLGNLKAVEKNINLKLIEETSKEDAQKKVRASGGVYLEINKGNIKVYGNDRYTMESAMVYGIVEGIGNSYNMATTIYSITNGEVIEVKPMEVKELFEVENIDGEKSPSSIDYYGVAEMGLMIFYYFSVPFWLMTEEKRGNIKDRMYITGLSKSKYYIGSFIGYVSISYIAVLGTYLLSKLIFNVNYGKNIFIVPLAILPFISMIIALGVLLMLVCKKYETANSIGSYVIIPALSFLGGGYIVINEGGKLFDIFRSISPLKWFNEAIFSYIYGGSFDLLIKWIVGGLALTLLMLVIIVFLARREELAGE